MNILSILPILKMAEKPLTQKLLHDHLDLILATKCFDSGHIVSSDIGSENMAMFLSTTPDKLETYKAEYMPRMIHHFKTTIEDPGYSKRTDKFVFQ